MNGPTGPACVVTAPSCLTGQQSPTVTAGVGAMAGGPLFRFFGNGLDAAADCVAAACNGGNGGLFFGNGGNGAYGGNGGSGRLFVGIGGNGADGAAAGQAGKEKFTADTAGYGQLIDWSVIHGHLLTFAIEAPGPTAPD